MEKLKIMISVFQDGEEYFAMRTFSKNMQYLLSHGAVFFVTDEVAPNEVARLEERAREEARKRGIPSVTNLD